MFGLSMGEILLLAAIALIAIGPKQLPDVARVLGRMLNEFRRASGDFQKALLDVKNDTDRAITGFQQSVEKTLTEQPKTPSTPESQQVAVDEANQLSFDMNTAAGKNPSDKKES